MIDGVKLMSEAELPNAAQALANAFFNDPPQTYTFPDESERRAKSPAHFAAALNYGLKFGEVYAAAKAGAVIWLKPGDTEITPERAEQGGFAALPGQIGSEAFERFFSVIGFGDQ